MRNRSVLVFLGVLLLIATAAAFGQAPASKLAFDVASVRPVAAARHAEDDDGPAGREEAGVGAYRRLARVFTYMSLKQLIAYAYKMRAYEVTGPDWMITDRFDIVARMPEGATKDDAPAMLQALLKERFGLTAHLQVVDQPVLGLVAAKNGAEAATGGGERGGAGRAAPLKPGESMLDTPDGRILLRRNADGSSTYVGPWGSFSLKFDGQSLSMHMQSESIDMKGFAMMMTSWAVARGARWWI